MGNCFFGFMRTEPDHTSFDHLLDSWDFDDMERVDKLARENDIPIDIVFEDFIYDSNIRSDPVWIPKRIR